MGDNKPVRWGVGTHIAPEVLVIPSVVVRILCCLCQFAEQNEGGKEDAHPAVILSISNPRHEHLEKRLRKWLQDASNSDAVNLTYSQSRCADTVLEWRELFDPFCAWDTSFQYPRPASCMSCHRQVNSDTPANAHMLKGLGSQEPTQCKSQFEEAQEKSLLRYRPWFLGLLRRRPVEEVPRLIRARKAAKMGPRLLEHLSDNALACVLIIFNELRDDRLAAPFPVSEDADTDVVLVTSHRLVDVSQGVVWNRLPSNVCPVIPLAHSLVVVAASAGLGNLPHLVLEGDIHTVLHHLHRESLAVRHYIADLSAVPSVRDSRSRGAED